MFGQFSGVYWHLQFSCYGICKPFHVPLCRFFQRFEPRRKEHSAASYQWSCLECASEGNDFIYQIKYPTTLIQWEKFLWCLMSGGCFFIIKCFSEFLRSQGNSCSISWIMPWFFQKKQNKSPLESRVEAHLNWIAGKVPQTRPLRAAGCPRFPFCWGIDANWIHGPLLLHYAWLEHAVEFGPLCKARWSNLRSSIWERKSWKILWAMCCGDWS